jgi:hypothetical protein
MLVKLDENITATLKEALRALGHYLDTISTQHLTGATDADGCTA